MGKKRFKIAILLAAVLAVSLFFFGCGSTDPNENPYNEDKVDNGYSITNLDVEVDATAGDRSMRITENYTFAFVDTVNPSHGFYRDIPVNSGEKIRNVSVTCPMFYNSYEISHEYSNFIRIKVGSADHTVLGSGYKCTISYTLITPPHAEYPDALVLNVIGQGWTCAIEQAKVSITLPAATTDVRYYYGEWGSEKDPFDDGIIDENPAAGQNKYSFDVKYLYAFQGFTVYYHLPKGALTTYSDNTVWAVLIVALILTAFGLLLKFTVGRNPPLAPVVQYYPPKHVGAGEHAYPMDPVDMGYLIDNKCQGTDVTSLIFYFASKGYLEIIAPKEDDKSGIMSLRKLCDLPEGLPAYQYTLFNKIFASKKKSTVSVSDLTYRTYAAVSTAQTQITDKYRGKLYDGKTRTGSICLCVLTALFAILTVLITSWRVSFKYINVVGVVAILPIIFSNLLGMYVVYNWLKMGKARRIAFLVLFGIMICAASLLLLLLTRRDTLDWASSIILLLGVALNCALAPFIARRTRYYTDELDQILGFKEFLQTAEKDRLEMLLAENPQYYYDILPYANVLGVSDIWEKKFANLTLQPPTYYRGSRAFSYVMFHHMYHRSFSAYSQAAVSRPPSSSSSSGGGRSSGGFGGGGGHSGGGFGGGGGGRW